MSHSTGLRANRLYIYPIMIPPLPPPDTLTTPRTPGSSYQPNLIAYSRRPPELTPAKKAARASSTEQA